MSLGDKNVAKFAYPHKVKNEIFLRTKDNNSWSHEMIWIILELERDIFMLSILSKFGKVPFEITWVRD